MTIRPLTINRAATYFIGYAALLFLMTEYLLPALMRAGVPSSLSWFAAGGVVFVSLFVHSIILYIRESGGFDFGQFMARFRFRRMNSGDWLWAIGGLVAVGALTAGIMKIEEALIPGFSPQPRFMHMEALAPGEMWHLGIWLIFFFFNIIGEEMMWRGYLLPRMELALGRYAWLVNGALWAIFHIPFGWHMVLMLLPILFIQPWIVQRRGNTWIGVVIHGLLNGPSFVMISLGIIE